MRTSQQRSWRALVLRYRRESMLGAMLLVVQMVSFRQSWVLMERRLSSPPLLAGGAGSASVEPKHSNGGAVVASTTTRQLSPALTSSSSSSSSFPQSTTMRQWLSMAADAQPPATPGAFLHLPKTGGSTLSLLLRHGCHATVLPKPCHNVTTTEQPVESYLSLLSTYYHIADFPKLDKTKNATDKNVSDADTVPEYAFYTLTLRDPLDRTLSSFTYTHPANQEAMGQFVRYRHRQFYQPCFPDLDHFAEALRSNNDTCGRMAHNVLNNRARWVQHLFFDAKYMQRVIPTGRPILVIRQEHLADDWRTANRALGQDDTTLRPPEQQLRRIATNQRLPVERDNMRDESRRSICEALLDEYQAYLAFVWQAINLQEGDRVEVYNRAMLHCSELNATLPSVQELDRRWRAYENVKRETSTTTTTTTMMPSVYGAYAHPGTASLTLGRSRNPLDQGQPQHPTSIKSFWTAGRS